MEAAKWSSERSADLCELNLKRSSAFNERLSFKTRFILSFLPWSNIGRFLADYKRQIDPSNASAAAQRDSLGAELSETHFQIPLKRLFQRNR